jgi:hypothetical protein
MVFIRYISDACFFAVSQANSKNKAQARICQGKFPLNNALKTPSKATVTVYCYMKNNELSTRHV